MSKIRNPVAMLAAGTIAAALSGFPIFWLRAAAFGFCLSLTVLFVQRKEWKRYAFIPGVALGYVLAFHPFRMEDLGIGKDHFWFDYPSLLNCALFIPLYAYAYMRPAWWPGICRLLIVGALSTAFRAISLGSAEEGLAYYWASLFLGTLPFLVLWLIAMGLTDPRWDGGAGRGTN